MLASRTAEWLGMRRWLVHLGRFMVLLSFPLFYKLFILCNTMHLAQRFYSTLVEAAGGLSRCLSCEHHDTISTNPIAKQYVSLLILFQGLLVQHRQEKKHQRLSLPY